jgi:sporulation protein YlmC with PRC-barrel domain
VNGTFHVEDLIGKPVRDAEGRKVGHIFEIVAEERDGELQILEYHLGKRAVLERVSASLRNMFGIRDKEPIRIPWQALDLTDLERPRMERAV